MAEFPRKIAGPFFKVKAHKEKRGKGPTAKRRASKRRKLDRAETANMRKVHKEDGYCRFPLCGCDHGLGAPNRTYLEVKPEVAHLEHRGMGGDPTGDRTQPDRLILLCNWRHKLSKFSLDRSGIKCEPLTDNGTRGRVAWLVQKHTLPISVTDEEIMLANGWIEVAVELSPHVFRPFTSEQLAVLRYLATMTA